MSRDYVLQPFREPATPRIDYARELNEQQCAAVTAPPGPALVIAGAGSGKTRTLTYRVAFLLEQGIPPDRILLLTFTNKAAREMMRRVNELLGQELNALWGGTFHSIGNRILRRHAAELGYSSGFTIMDREDAKHLLTGCVAELNIDKKATGFPKSEVLADMFSLAVNTQKPLNDLLEKQYEHFSHLSDVIQNASRLYAERKRAANALDFDDLLVLWLRLLRDHPAVREAYQRRFQFILVDEYQDTNKLQGDLIDLLAERHKNVMVVGDDAQSIYAWRGANYQNILKFPERYPGSKIYKIETNYRSTPEILRLANEAISANVGQFAKELAPARKSGNKPVLVSCNDGGEQAAFVAQRVTQLLEEGGNLSRMAVLYRSHFHAMELQMELTKRRIPFTITSGLRFFEQAHIKDVAAYLKLAANPQDELAFKRLAELLPGIGGKGAEKLWREFDKHRPPTAPPSPATLPPDQDDAAAAAPNAEVKADVAGGAAPSGPSLAVRLQRCAGAVPKKARVPWAQFVATVSQLEASDVSASAARMIELVIEAGYEDYLEETYVNAASRLEDLKQMSVFARQFTSLPEFLTQLALLSNVDADDADAADEDKLKLSTIHQAKGLEFDVVFIIMLCDGLFPSERSMDDEEGEEEERRLFYVAITRARNELYLSYPLMRAGFGEKAPQFQQASRFLAEISKESVEEWNLRPYHPYE
jgi:DNA helicase-2/ATP-dependent DNA helicase PcrA